MKLELEMIADYACECGENPLWDDSAKLLYWTDIPRGVIFAYNPATHSHGTIYEGDVVGGFTLQENGDLLLFGERGAVKLLRDTELITVVEEIEEERATRFNDVIADPGGRVFCGTLGESPHPARLYRLDTDRSVVRVVDGIGLSNGLGFTLDKTALYYTDSANRVIYVFDYDLATGAISNQRVFHRLEHDEWVPDGMTVDSEGCIWSAIWGGSCVIRYDHAGKEMLRIPIPAPFVTSVAFGGESFEDLYVTTADGKDRPADQSWGALFRLRPGVRGVAEFRSRVQS
ncbi:MAG: SMP-30/gluconolactonase/LRE family protein [Armatimonadetes bacterium]|nr:SMP-30/gluconolactonase/LRE family protein [Armatimonadota bacterium]